MWPPKSQRLWHSLRCKGRTFEQWRSRLLFRIHRDVEKDPTVEWRGKIVGLRSNDWYINHTSYLVERGSAAAWDNSPVVLDWLRAHLERRGFIPPNSKGRWVTDEGGKQTTVRAEIEQPQGETKIVNRDTEVLPDGFLKTSYVYYDVVE